MIVYTRWPALVPAIRRAGHTPIVIDGSDPVPPDAPEAVGARGTFLGDLDRMPSGHTCHCEARRRWGDGECECGHGR
jgi:hypothetical protein